MSALFLSRYFAYKGLCVKLRRNRMVDLLDKVYPNEKWVSRFKRSSTTTLGVLIVLFCFCSGHKVCEDRVKPWWAGALWDETGWTESRTHPRSYPCTWRTKSWMKCASQSQGQLKFFPVYCVYHDPRRHVGRDYTKQCKWRILMTWQWQYTHTHTHTQDTPKPTSPRKKSSSQKTPHTQHTTPSFMLHV